ncbi:precorrin-3B C(17)-methyltransferase [Streptomyces sp. NPDC004327]|uniref:precorrin-3B C(17)-methyltransferase n=1 Tax=Streptomyces sp. NPDC004327 TaxID=3364699 RepID=UPI0036AB8462
MRTRVPVTAAVLVGLLASGCAGVGTGGGVDPRSVRPVTGEPSAVRSSGSGDPTMDAERRKYEENHGYRREMELTDDERGAAAGKAQALKAVLDGLAGTKVTEDQLRDAVAPAMGVEPRSVEVRGEFGGLLKSVEVGGGTGKVCVNGRIGSAPPKSVVSAEVAGRTMDGTCLPGLGGH